MNEREMQWEAEQQLSVELEELFGPTYSDYTHDEIGSIAECRKCGALVRRGWREEGAEIHLKWHKDLDVRHQALLKAVY